MAERALKIHAPDIPLALSRRDAHEVGHGPLRVMSVGGRAMIHQLAGDELVGSGRFLFRNCRLSVDRLAAAPFEGADEAIALELGGRITPHVKTDETCREPGFLLEEIRAADLDDTGRAFLPRDCHHTSNHDSIFRSGSEPVLLAAEGLHA